MNSEKTGSLFSYRLLKFSEINVNRLREKKLQSNIFFFNFFVCDESSSIFGWSKAPRTYLTLVPSMYWTDDKASIISSCSTIFHTTLRTTQEFFDISKIRLFHVKKHHKTFQNHNRFKLENNCYMSKKLAFLVKSTDFHPTYSETRAVTGWVGWVDWAEV